MCNMFRTLRADEIDARVGTAKDGGKGVSLLLYKDARCDQNILDETVGPYNWQRSHSRDNANCIVSIWDKEKQQWISKEDTGTESKTEAEKGLASDSFKRACFNWGIGRELYSAPFIWIPGDPQKLKYEKFRVLEIGYDENREINKLAIADKSGVVVYKYGNVTMKTAQMKTETPPADGFQPGEKMNLPPAGSWNYRDARSKFCEVNAISQQAFANIRATLIQRGAVKNVSLNDIDPIDFDSLCSAIKATIPEYIAYMDSQRVSA